MVREVSKNSGITFGIRLDGRVVPEVVDGGLTEDVLPFISRVSPFLLFV